MIKSIITHINIKIDEFCGIINNVVSDLSSVQRVVSKKLVPVLERVGKNKKGNSFGRALTISSNNSWL